MLLLPSSTGFINDIFIDQKLTSERLFFCFSRYAPSAFLECFIPHWFHGLMGRVESEQTLNMTCRDGTFLVRERRTKPGWFALSVWCPDGTVHVPLGRRSFFCLFMWTLNSRSIKESQKQQNSNNITI